MMAPALVASSGVFKTNFLQMKDTYKDTYPQYHPCWWFENYLPEPYRSQAIERYDGQYESTIDLLSALCIGFVWIFEDYWIDLSIRIKAGEFNTPIP